MRNFLIVILALTVSPKADSQLANAVDTSQADPHWSRHSCQVCHENPAPVPANLGLKTGTSGPLCQDCHGSGGDARPCRHVSGILPGRFADHLPPSYQAHLEDGKVVCTTCHDLAVQCTNPSKTLQYKNPGFVRGGRFSTSSDQCYLCHEMSNFERVSPHKQAAQDTGNKSCLLCHASEPQQTEDSGWQPVNFNLAADLNDICLGCHPVRSHPAPMSLSRNQPEWAHLVVPSEEILQNMQEFTVESGVVLPLEPGTGKVHCATCHNPHHDQLQGYPVAETPGSDYRLRTVDMCNVCHDM